MVYQQNSTVRLSQALKSLPSLPLHIAAPTGGWRYRNTWHNGMKRRVERWQQTGLSTIKCREGKLTNLKYLRMPMSDWSGCLPGRGEPLQQPQVRKHAVFPYARSINEGNSSRGSLKTFGMRRPYRKRWSAFVSALDHLLWNCTPITFQV